MEKEMRNIQQKQEMMNVLNNDIDLLKLYHKTEKCTLLDNKLIEIIESDNIKTLKKILVTFDSYKNEPMFKDILKNISNKIREIKMEKLV